MSAIRTGLWKELNRYKLCWNRRDCDSQGPSYCSRERAAWFDLPESRRTRCVSLFTASSRMVIELQDAAGGSGVAFAAGFGERLSLLVEGRYTIYGFDPRGIGATRPRVECFPSTLEYELFKAGTILERGFDIPKDLSRTKASNTCSISIASFSLCRRPSSPSVERRWEMSSSTWGLRRSRGISSA